MLFVFCLDAGFLMPTGVALRSLDQHLAPTDRVAILHIGLTQDDVSKLASCASNAQVTFHACDTRPLDRSWVPPKHVSLAAFLRYLAPETLHEESRCVYLDGDVLVRRDPTPLFNVELKGNTVGAVQSRVTPFLASKGGVAAWREEELDSMAPYFNSGVLVMDLERWRDRGITASITSYLAQHGRRANLADQEALNVAVYQDWTRLDRTWNYVTYVADYFLQVPEDEPESPAIAHFAGRSKPWEYERAPLFTDEWLDTLEQTPWAGFIPQAKDVPRPPLIMRIARSTLRALSSRRST